MCAIYGVIGKVDQKLIKQISDVQIYRGPDQQNIIESNDKLSILGNNRLSVIDKEKGVQPMRSDDGRYTIIFNGCIYNFIEIKNYLKEKKIKFKTNSDTEVFLKSFMYFGEKTFNYLDGMWSVAIYDSFKKICILSRDYVGQKPLYYCIQKEYVLFSSQISGFFLDKNIDKSISQNNLEKYFAYSFVPAPKTIFKNIFQVRPGEYISINSNTLEYKRKTYWNLCDGPDFNLFNKKISSDSFNENLNEIIKNFTLADQKVAVSLSGGLDSNIILSSLTNQNLFPNSFSVGFNNSSFDEMEKIKYVSGNFENKIIQADNKLLIEKFLELSKLINEPNGDSSILPTYLLFDKIKKYTNVCLGGDGGDETFYGYITFDAILIASRLKKIFPFKILNILKKKFFLKENSENYMSFNKKVNRFFRSIDLDVQFLLPSWMSCMSVEEISNKFKKKIDVKNLYDETDEIFNNEFSLLKKAQLYYFKYYLPMVLAKVDQASMFSSVESRAPFLSKKIVNFSLSQEESALYSMFNKKKFLKQKYKNIISKKIINSPKHGFAFPTNIILKNKNLINESLNTDLIDNHEFFKIKYDEHINNERDNSQYLWNEIVLNLSLKNLNSI